MASTQMTLNEQAQEILRIAAEHGVEQNFLFITTFERYSEQIRISNSLKKIIADEGTMVTKEYVKNRKNLYVNPAITESNRTSTAANQTAQTLMKIITTMRDDSGDGGKDDELLAFIKGHRPE